MKIITSWNLFIIPYLNLLLPNIIFDYFLSEVIKGQIISKGFFYAKILPKI